MLFDDLTEEYLEAVSMMMRQPEMKASHKMHGGETGILCYLRKHEGRATPGELQKNLNVGSGRIANALGTLENKGFISRVNAQDDKRKTYVYLTDEGRDMLNQEWREYLEHNKMILTVMGEKNSREFIRLLRLFAEINAELLNEKKG